MGDFDYYEKTFLQDILASSEVFACYFFGSTYVVISLAPTKFPPHNNVLPVAKECMAI